MVLSLRWTWTRIKGKILTDSGEIQEGCIEFARHIKWIRKDCVPDIEFGQGRLITPGAVDMHTHMRGAQVSYKEDVNTFTAEAVYGGITVTVDMPNTVPPINTRQRIMERIREFEEGRTDFGIYSGVGSEDVDDMPIAGYKIFPEDLESKDVMNVMKSTKLKILHPELPQSIREDRRLRGYWEELGSLYFLEGSKFHITHITGPNTARLAKGMGFTVDATPHHLLLSSKRGCLWKVNPPLRPLELVRGLFPLIFDGLDAVASDHAPHSSHEKSLPETLCPPGIAAISFSVPFLYSLAFRGIISFERASQLISRGPSSILSINTGKIEPGRRANFTVIGREEWRYHTQFSKVIQTPLDLYKLETKVEMTIVEGKVAYDGNDVYPIRGVNLFE